MAQVGEGENMRLNRDVQEDYISLPPFFKWFNVCCHLLTCYNFRSGLLESIFVFNHD